MKTVKLTKDVEHEGRRKGDVVSYDELSAAALIKRGDAEEYEPDKADTAERVETIDDIVDPAVVRNKRVMTATVVGAADAGPVRRAPDDDPADAPVEPDPLTATPEQDVQSPTVKAANARRGRGGSELAAPAADAAGGDASGGDGS